MKKYRYQCLDSSKGFYQIEGPGFSTQVCSAQVHPIEFLVGDFNRLADIESGLREDLRVQIEAKCKVIKRVEAFEFGQTALVDWFRNDGREYGHRGDSQNWTPQETAVHALKDLTAKNRDLNQLCEERGEKLARSVAGNKLLTKKLSDKRKLCEKLGTAIRESQKILADYLAKPPVISDKRNLRRMDRVINLLLNVLDHRDLVTLVNEIPCGGEPYLDMLSSKPTNWPHWATHLFCDEDGWQFGRLIEEKSSRHWVDADSNHAATRMWTLQNIIDGTLEARFEDYTVKVATDAQGNTYAAGIGVDMPSDWGKRLGKLDDLVKTQGMNIDSHYMRGLYNGLVLAQSCFTDKDPDYRESINDPWLICNKVGEPLRYRNVNTGEESSDPFPKPFIVDGDKLSIHGGMLSGLDAAQLLEAIRNIISETQLAPSVTTNHFAPSKKLKRKNRKLKNRIKELEQELHGNASLKRNLRD